MPLFGCYHRVGSKINFSLLYTPGFFPLSVSCWYFICLYLAEFLSHPQHSQILFLPFFFLLGVGSVSLNLTILSDVVFSFPVCVPPSVVRKQTHFFGVESCDSTVSCPKLFSHIFLSRCFETLQAVEIFPFCSAPLVSPQSVPLEFTAQSVAGEAGNKRG